MCELFGITATEKIELNELLREFFSDGYAHPNGWGMAFFSGSNVSIEKQPENACSSLYLRQRLRAKTLSDCMIAHIRLATKGSISYENTHPFCMQDKTGRSWTLAHNGTIFECGALDPYVRRQHGTTDSERILMHIIENINSETKRPCGMIPAERFGVFDKVMSEISPENKVNILLYDGELLYVHTNFHDSLYMLRVPSGVIISTRPLNLRKWEKVPMNTPLAFKNGDLLFTGTDHGHEFFETEEKMRMLFLDYAMM